MRTESFEFDNFEPPSNNEVRHMNPFVYKRIVQNLKDKINLFHGEGPWPKLELKGNYSKAVREQTRKKLRDEWPKRVRVLADFVIRRPRRFDQDNSAGGMKPVWDALVRTGWMVDDHEKWFWYIQRPQIVGDPKLVITLTIPQTLAEEKELEKRIYG